jgi:hypothetical protein
MASFSVTVVLVIFGVICRGQGLARENCQNVIEGA